MIGQTTKVIKASSVWVAKRTEVVRALQRMKNKMTGPDEIPVEAWRALGGVGVDLLWNLMFKM